MVIALKDENGKLPEGYEFYFGAAHYERKGRFVRTLIPVGSLKSNKISP